MSIKKSSVMESKIPINKYKFGYLGGTFSEKEVKGALKDNYPLTLDMALPGKCQNNCVYCGYYEVNKSNKLTIEEIQKIIQEFSELGGKSIKILGEGEPLLRKDILEVLRCIQSWNITPVLFTSGDVLGDNILCERIFGFSNKELVDKLYTLECTIVLKYEASGEKQDHIVNKMGYYQKRDKALNLLIQRGFNKNEITRLGFGIVLLKMNYNNIPAIFNYALSNNIYPLVCPLMPIGKMRECEERKVLSPSSNEIANLKIHLCNCKKQYGYNDSDESDFPGGRPCDISRTGFYVDDTGNAFICESDECAGNIRTQSLKELWSQINEVKWKKYGEMRKYGLCFPKRKVNIL